MLPALVIGSAVNPLVWSQPVMLWTDRDNSVRIYLPVTGVIMATDMLQIDCISNPRHLINLAQEAIQIRIINNTPVVAFEMRDINIIETD